MNPLDKRICPGCGRRPNTYSCPHCGYEGGHEPLPTTRQLLQGGADVESRGVRLDLFARSLVRDLRKAGTQDRAWAANQWFLAGFEHALRKGSEP